MVRFGNFEVEYNRNAPDKVSVRIETDDKGEVWLPKCDIARAYGVFVQSVNAGLKSLAKTGDFDEYRDVRVEHFTYNGKYCSVDLYSLATIIALGFRMKGLKCEAFRKWAARRLAESFEKYGDSLHERRKEKQLELKAAGYGGYTCRDSLPCSGGCPDTCFIQVKKYKTVNTLIRKPIIMCNLNPS